MDKVLPIVGICFSCSRVVRGIESVIHHDDLPNFILERAFVVLLWREDFPEAWGDVTVDGPTRTHPCRPSPVGVGISVLHLLKEHIVLERGVHCVPAADALSRGEDVIERSGAADAVGAT